MEFRTDTKLRSVECDVITGDVRLKFDKNIYRDKTLISCEPHRASFQMDTDTATQIEAVNAHLDSLGFPIAKDEISASTSLIDGLRKLVEPQAVLADASLR